jgi:putative transposase
MGNFKGSQVERESILGAVRWYVASPISYRPLEERRGERGGAVDHSTLNRWVIKYAPAFEKALRRRQCPVARSWRMDETSVRIRGKGAYGYRAVDTEGHTSDFLLPPTRDRDAAEAFLRKALRTQGLPEKVTLDQSGANMAALTHYTQTPKTALPPRHSKYLNNLVEQDHRAVQWITRPLRGFHSFWAACGTLAGIEVRPAIRQGPLISMGTVLHTPAEQFYALAA